MTVHELIPRQVRSVLRDVMGGWGLYTVAEIGEVFEAEGFERSASFEPTSTGARRSTVDAFQASVDFASVEHVERYLRVLERVLMDHESDDGRERRDKLLAALGRAQITLTPAKRLVLPTLGPAMSARLGALPTDSDIRLHASRLERLDQAPEEMIGAAKELVEATAKYALQELGEAIGDREDVDALSARALAALLLHPKTIAPTAKGADVMKRVLGGVAQVAIGLAELRNMGYGTGHGRARRISGLKQRHGEVAARAAIAYSMFMLDTLADPDAPWRAAHSTAHGEASDSA